MNIDKDIINTKLQKILAFGQQHFIVIVITLFGILYGYIILQISAIANDTPNEVQVAEQIKAVPQPKVNKETAKTIEGLQEQNVNVQAIFNDARDNPFSE